MDGSRRRSRPLTPRHAGFDATQGRARLVSYIGYITPVFSGDHGGTLMKPDLVLIASASQARLFARHSADADLQLLASFTHPEGRLKAGALGDDRPGHGSSDDRPGGISFTPREDLHKKERVHFARELADRIDESLRTGTYGRVAVFAGSPFLGELKKELSPAAGKAIQSAIDLDLSAFEGRELAHRVQTELGGPAS